MKYFATLSDGLTILWCYLLWYVFFVYRYFDPSPSLWFTSIGISGIIGTALVISSSTRGTRLDRWQVFRLFLMPFCVSSFSALIKGKGFILIFSPWMQENLVALTICALFCLFVVALKFRRRATG